MTPSKQTKELGFKRTLEVLDQLGIKPNGRHVVSAQTFDNWCKNKPELFDAVITGVAYKQGLLDGADQQKQPAAASQIESIVSSELMDFKDKIPRLLELERKARLMVESNYFKPAIMGFEAALRELD